MATEQKLRPSRHCSALASLSFMEQKQILSEPFEGIMCRNEPDEVTLLHEGGRSVTLW